MNYIEDGFPDLISFYSSVLNFKYGKEVAYKF